MEQAAMYQAPFEYVANPSDRNEGRKKSPKLAINGGCFSNLVQNSARHSQLYPGSSPRHELQNTGFSSGSLPGSVPDRRTLSHLLADDDYFFGVLALSRPRGLGSAHLASRHG